MSDHTAQTLSLDQFAVRFERAAPVLWCVAASVLGSRDAAEDVVQDAAVQAMAKLSTFRADTDFTAWMAKIVRYTALNQARRTRKQPQRLDAEHDDPIAPTTSAPTVSADGNLLPEQTELDDHVMHGLNGLDETQRTCLLLRTIMDLSYQEIGTMLEIPKGTAMSHVHRARLRLVEQLRDQPTDGDTRKAQ